MVKFLALHCTDAVAIRVESMIYLSNIDNGVFLEPVYEEEALEKIFREWSFKGINMYNIIYTNNGRRHEIQDTPFGRMIWCLKNVLDFEDYLCIQSPTVSSELIQTSELFWKLCKMTY